MDQREGLRISADEFVVPLALLMKRPLVHFDLRNEEQHAIPLLTADQHRTIARELLYRQLDSDLAGQDIADDAVVLAAGELIEAVLADEPRDVEPQIDALAAAHAVELADFRATASVLSRYFILWAVVRGLDRRRVFKFAFDEPVGPGRASCTSSARRGCTEAESYHVEVAVPGDLEARRTLLVDGATRRLAAGEPDADRLSLLPGAGAAARVTADRDRLRGRALAVPRTGGARRLDHRAADRPAVPVLGPEGAARHGGSRSCPGALDVGRVLGPRPSHRRAPAAAIDARAARALAASTVAALFAAASIGFRTAGWIIEGTWALAALASVLTAVILIVEAIRAPR